LTPWIECETIYKMDNDIFNLLEALYTNEGAIGHNIMYTQIRKGWGFSTADTEITINIATANKWVGRADNTKNDGAGHLYELTEKGKDEYLLEAEKRSKKEEKTELEYQLVKKQSELIANQIQTNKNTTRSNFTLIGIFLITAYFTFSSSHTARLAYELELKKNGEQVKSDTLVNQLKSQLKQQEQLLKAKDDKIYLQGLIIDSLKKPQE
jgi:hypothetical protein